MTIHRCAWAEGHELLKTYHDEEWGVPVRDDRRLFEMLTLEGAQAGLSWLTVLKKRARYREVFANFEIACVAEFGPTERDRALADAGLIRHAGKIDSVIGNARATLALIAEGTTLSQFIWQFTDATEMSRALKRRGYRFVGPTICHAFMQAAGLIDDHERTCFRRGRSAAPELA